MRISQNQSMKIYGGSESKVRGHQGSVIVSDISSFDYGNKGRLQGTSLSVVNQSLEIPSKKPKDKDDIYLVKIDRQVSENLSLFKLFKNV